MDFVSRYVRLGNEEPSAVSVPGGQDLQRVGVDVAGGGGGGGVRSVAVDVDDAALWGYLQPCGNGVPRIDLYKEILRYTVGREAGRNYVTLAALKISASHCVLTWDPKASVVTVLDMSSNGTWLDGEKVGKGKTREMKDGAEICFGTTIPQPRNGGIEDFRYVFHYTASGPPKQGIKAYFTIGNQLGKGSFGSVYEATHTVTGLKFAVKRIVKGGPSGMSQKAVGRLLEGEVGTMKRLEHPNVCRLIGVFDCAERISLVLEYVGGGDLLKLMEERYPCGLPEIAAKDLVYQACDALAFIHSKGIIHQDLKPENILLTTDRHPIVKIADFGCSRAIDCVTMLRTQCGTPYYLAPEMADMHVTQELAHKVDSWSMGVIVYSMLTGKCPFVKDPLLTRHDAIRDWTIDWATFGNQPALYPESLSFIDRLLQQDPEKRMALADSFTHAWLKDHVPFHKNIAVVFRPGYVAPPPLPPAVPPHLRNIFMSPKKAQEKAKSGLLRSVPAVEAAPATSANAGAGVVARSDSSEVFDLLMSGHSQESVRSVGSVGSTGRGLGVRRRSEVIAEAAENGTSLPQPSEAMIANTASRREGRVTRAMAMADRIDQLGVIVEEAGGDSGGAGNVDVAMESPVKVTRTRARNKMKENAVNDDDDDDVMDVHESPVKPSAKLSARRKGKGVVSRNVRGPAPAGVVGVTRRSSRSGLKGRKTKGGKAYVD